MSSTRRSAQIEVPQLDAGSEREWVTSKSHAPKGTHKMRASNVSHETKAATVEDIICSCLDGHSYRGLGLLDAATSAVLFCNSADGGHNLTSHCSLLTGGNRQYYCICG
jgi:hypothetical protein